MLLLGQNISEVLTVSWSAFFLYFTFGLVYIKITIYQFIVFQIKLNEIKNKMKKMSISMRLKK